MRPSGSAIKAARDCAQSVRPSQNRSMPPQLQNTRNQSSTLSKEPLEESQLSKAEMDYLKKCNELINKPTRNIRLSSNPIDFDINDLERRAILSRLDHMQYDASLMSLENRSAIVSMLQKDWNQKLVD
jgi:ribosomal protein S24E